MTSPVSYALAALSFLAAIDAAPATAAEWTRGTAHGGQISRSTSADGRVYSGATTRTGPNGGSYTSNSTCVDGVVDRCRRSYSATGPNGQTYSGQRATARGPYQVRSVGTVTGPQGNVAGSVRRHWR